MTGQAVLLLDLIGVLPALYRTIYHPNGGINCTEQAKNIKTLTIYELVAGSGFESRKDRRWRQSQCLVINASAASMGAALWVTLHHPKTKDNSKSKRGS